MSQTCRNKESSRPGHFCGKVPLLSAVSFLHIFLQRRVVLGPGEGEALPLVASRALVQYTLLVVLGSSGIVRGTPIQSMRGMSPPQLPSVTSLWNGMHQVWVTFFYWMAVHVTTCCCSFPCRSIVCKLPNQ